MGKVVLVDGNEMEYNAPDAVPQELVLATIIGILHPRPVIIKIDGRVRQTEAQIHAIVDSLMESPVTVTCSPELEWEELASYFRKATGSCLVLSRVNHLSRSLELRLGYALIQPDPELREFLHTSALIFTTTESLEKMNPFLRRQILLKQDTDAIDVDSVLVEPPKHSLLSTDRHRTIAKLHQAMLDVEIVPELLRYMQDIIIFVRTHRFTLVGLRPQASADFELIVRTLCALRGASIATPMVIKDAARLTLPVHVKMVSAEDEPSLQYGGDHNLVKNWIKEWDSEVLVDYVLDQVPVPR